MYLQVTSVKPRDIAETVARTLKGKGLPTTLSPGPDGKTRVWVGPYTDRGKLGEAKAELERLGFGPFVVKPVK
jgi:cell division septation protein DedD